VSNPEQAPPAGAGQDPARPGEPSEAELRAAYEAELSRMTASDVIAQATISLLNIGAYRLSPPPGAQAGEGDLEQARDAIDAVRALLEILERRIPQELRPLRDALSQMQMAYARAAAAEAPATAAPGPGGPGGQGSPAPGAEGQGEPAGQAPPAGQPPAGAPEAGQDQSQRGPGPAESSGRLWVPGR
jgi:hypothetical protein